MRLAERVAGRFPHFLEDGGERTKTGKSRLEQVQTDERGEEQPVGVVVMGQQHAQHYEEAGNSQNDTFNSHPGMLQDWWWLAGGYYIRIY